MLYQLLNALPVDVATQALDTEPVSLPSESRSLTAEKRTSAVEEWARYPLGSAVEVLAWHRACCEQRGSLTVAGSLVTSGDSLSQSLGVEDRTQQTSGMGTPRQAQGGGPQVTRTSEISYTKADSVEIPLEFQERFMW